MLFKLIVGAMGLAIETGALAIIAACAITAYGYAGEDSTTGLIFAFAGAAAGVLISAVVLGMPILLLRMNKNLDELNTNLARVRERVDAAGNAPHPAVPPPSALGHAPAVL